MLEVEILPPRAERRPIPGPLIVLQTGHALLPSMRSPDSVEVTRIEQGLRLGWMPTPEIGGLLLLISDGRAHTPTLATVISRSEISDLIEDLKSIDAQLGALGIR